MDPIMASLIERVTALEGKLTLLIWFVGATMVPVWMGAITQLWKASKVAQFLDKGK